jgi:hypothetical protein
MEHENKARNSGEQGNMEGGGTRDQGEIFVGNMRTKLETVGSKGTWKLG